MSVTVYFANVSKKRNSTYQGTFTVSYDCTLKAPTSLDRPTFLVSAASMDYNAAKMGDRYYFIDDVVSVRNGQWEVSCILDVLATYKADILASTQYVTYSANSAKTWLADARIPILKSCSYQEDTKANAQPFSQTGFYVLTVVGKEGTRCYGVNEAIINNIIKKIQDWTIDDYTKVLSGLYNPDAPMTYDWSSTEAAIKSFAQVMSQTGTIGNAYQNAPQMIRSCIWVPFDPNLFYQGASEQIYLGNYATNVYDFPLHTTPYSVGYTLNIPWKYSDWRRAVCETVYIRLPYVGLIQLGSDTLTSETQLRIVVSATCIDGGIAYQIITGSGKTVGYYGGSCAASYSIGINQRTGAGEVLQTAIAGIERTVSTAIDSNLSPMSIAGAVAGAALEGVNTVYQTANAAMSTHPSCIGNMGGAASAGLDQTISVIVASHDTAVEPSAMAATMGRPTMEPMSLSGLTGFCQCANAHVAVAAQAREIDAIDFYLNSGFFIE